jgi:hypothetical protein
MAEQPAFPVSLGIASSSNSPQKRSSSSPVKITPIFDGTFPINTLDESVLIQIDGSHPGR